MPSSTTRFVVRCDDHETDKHGSYAVAKRHLDVIVKVRACNLPHHIQEVRWDGTAWRDAS